MAVAFVVLLNGSSFLDVFPRPFCCRQLRHCPLDVVEELVSQSAHEHDDVEPLKRLTPSCPVGVSDLHHRHSQPHESPVLTHDPLCVLTDSLLLVLCKSSEDVRCLFQWRAGDPSLLELLLEVVEGREHPAIRSIVLHDAFEP